MKRFIPFILTLVIVALFARWQPEAEYGSLYHNGMTGADRQIVVEALSEWGEPYKWDQQTSQLLVEAHGRGELRRRLLELGVPSGVSEIREWPVERVDLTVQEEHARRQLVLKAEIEELMRGLPEVQDAEVRLAIPDMTYFCDPNRKCQARIILELQRGEPEPLKRLETISQFIRISVPLPGLGGVVVLDGSGRELYSVDYHGEPTS